MDIFGKAMQDTITVATSLTYNVLRNDAIPLKTQKAGIKKYWGNRLLTQPVLRKDDKRYITFTVVSSSSH